MFQFGSLERSASAHFSPLSEAEMMLVRMAPIGKTAYCGPNEDPADPNNDPTHSDGWSKDRDIRAGLLRWLCYDQGAKNFIDPYGIRIYAARIRTAVDLSCINIPFPIALRRCQISEQLNLDLTEIPDLDLTGSRVKELRAEYASIRGSIALKDGFQSTGPIELSGILIGGSLRCDNGKFENPPLPGIKMSGAAINAENAKITGDVLVREGFLAKGSVWLMGATIGGNLECWDGKFENQALKSTQGKSEEADVGMALNGDGINVHGDVLLRDGFSALGKVTFVGAQIGGDLDCDGGTFTNPAVDGVDESGTALTVESATVTGDIFLGKTRCKDGTKRRFSAKGEVNLDGARIGGVLNCDGGSFENPARTGIEDSGVALAARSLRVTDSVLLGDEFSAIGAVDLDGATVDGLLECDGGKFQNVPCYGVKTSGTALSAKSIEVGDSVILNNKFSATGSVKLNSAKITRRLELDKGTFESLDLTDSSASSIVDDEDSWPQHSYLSLDGFTYERISAGPIDAVSRLKWLERQGKFARQPYHQLAKILNDAGDDEGWRTVCYEMEKRAWGINRQKQIDNWKKARIKGLPGLLLAQGADYLLRGLIGYGYRSFRALYWLVMIWVAWGALYYVGFLAGIVVPTDKENYSLFVENRSVLPSYEQFHVTAYSLENSFPLIKLGIQDKWEPSPDNAAAPERLPACAGRILRPVVSPGFLRWARWVQIGLGWVLTTFFAAGVSGLIRKD